MGRIVKTFPGKDILVRVLKLKHKHENDSTPYKGILITHKILMNEIFFQFGYSGLSIGYYWFCSILSVSLTNYVVI